MKRLCLVLLGVLCWNPPASAQDEDLGRIGRELGRMNDILEYGPGGGGGGLGAGIMSDMQVAAVAAYYSERGHRERKQLASRKARAKAKREKLAAFRAKCRAGV